MTVKSAAWMEHAACQGERLSNFFGGEEGRGGPGKDALDQQAVAFCRAYCTVRSECLNYALAADIKFGVWGGETEAGRRNLARRRQRRAA